MNNCSICNICGKEFKKIIWNLDPMYDSDCCSECNKNVVIPKRLQHMRNRDKYIC